MNRWEKGGAAGGTECVKADPSTRAGNAHSRHSSAQRFGKGQPGKEKSQMAAEVFYTTRKGVSDSENAKMEKDETKLF